MSFPPRRLSSTSSSNTDAQNTMTDHGEVTDHKGLADFIARCPIIDNHAHPLLPLKVQQDRDLLTITSEAFGDALAAVPSSLPFIRAVTSLCQTAGISLEGASSAERFRRYLDWRHEREETSFTRDSFAGIQTLLLDDGLRNKDSPHPYNWHSQFLQSPAKRIVRIETLAEDILATRRDQSGDAFLRTLETAIKVALQDSEVAGFKSAICYRSGLALEPKYDRSAVDECLRVVASSAKSGTGHIKINSKPLNDLLVHCLATCIREHIKATGRPPKPIQFHTGLGDNDLQLTLANPAHLQPFIEAYPDVPIVLLHASYPFTEEAGYLASVFSNAYLDVGEIFPMISRYGQEEAIKKALALAPTDKLCWSTDGHFYQETYSLAVSQMREVLTTVLSEMVAKKDCSFQEAAGIAKALLFDTSNKLYRLALPFQLNATSTAAPTSKGTSVQAWKGHLAANPDIKFLMHYWVDFSGTVRTRVLPRDYLSRLLTKVDADGRSFAIVAHGLFLLQDDRPGIPDFVATDEIPFYPSLDSLRIHPRSGYATIMGDFSSPAGNVHPDCPRTLLQQSLHKLKGAGLTQIMMGFELEFHLFDQAALSEGKLVPISSAHAWSTARALHAGGGKALSVLEDIVAALQSSGIEVTQFHSESGAGQYEIPLGPLPVLEAVDQLVQAREILAYVAATHGYRASCHPKPSTTGAGSGMHLHMSLKPTSHQDAFYAGVLEELPSVCAFSLGGVHSYDRVQDGVWSGGTYCTWGEQNREAPLRRVNAADAHWEMKCFDGLANPYLAVAAILTAGRLGIQQQMRLGSPCNVSASKLSSEDRQRLGITKTMPRSLKEAISNFFNAYGKRTSLVGTLVDPDSRVTTFIREFGAEPAIRYAQVKEQEAALLKQLEVRKDGITAEQAAARSRLYMVDRY